MSNVGCDYCCGTVSDHERGCPKTHGPDVSYEPCECGHEWSEHSWQPRSDLPAQCNKCLCSDYVGDPIDICDPEDESA